ncbi:MAG: lipase family protein [Planctomycetota bacterium]|jgi:hypothetical protein
MIGIKKKQRLSGVSQQIMLLIVCCAFIAGCGSDVLHSSQLDRFGRTYYIDGAGNWGFGVLEVISGLQRAGYKGNIINYRWSPTFNPALDQTVGRPVARLKGASLGKEISRYLNKHPGTEVNIISLSAGTGVAVWACENVEPPAKVSTLIMLGSSLSANYDMRKALKNISKGVWVYCSTYDQVLQGPVQALGTIDGQMGVPSAGTVGLRAPRGGGNKIHNVRWSSRYERYGWTGAHTDATSEPFVRMVLAGHILQKTRSTKDKAKTDEKYYVVARDGSTVTAVTGKPKNSRKQ